MAVNFISKLFLTIFLGGDIMTKLSRTRKKPKKAVVKQAQKPRAEDDPCLTERIFGLLAARIDGGNGKTHYFRVEHAAQILRVDYALAQAEFERLIGMDALEKAKGGSYLATSDFARAYARYQARQSAGEGARRRVH